MFPWASFLTYAAVTAATPGPNNLMSMSNAGRLGLKRALPFNLGIWCGFSAVMLACSFFCAALSELLPAVRTPMLVAGAAYMLYLAWKTWTSGPIEGGGEAGRGFLQGLLLQFVNPKIYIYCIVSMETYILPVYAGQWGMLAWFALLLALIGFLFTLCWAVFGSALRALFGKHAKITNAVMALMLVYCAISLFL